MPVEVRPPGQGRDAPTGTNQIRGGRNLGRHDRSRLREALLLLFLGMIITMIGVRLLPPKDAEIEFSSQLVVEAPPAVTDAYRNRTR
jgi:hypothetical protein